MLVIDSKLRIPLAELEFTYARSSGPGGQNVNKVNSKAILRWSVARSPSLPEAVRGRFLRKHGRRLTLAGDLLITSQRYRDQGRNVADCLEKLRAMLIEVAQPPTARKPTRPGRAAVERRLQGKQQAAAKKRQRRRPAADD